MVHMLRRVLRKGIGDSTITPASRDKANDPGPSDDPGGVRSRGRDDLRRTILMLIPGGLGLIATVGLNIGFVGDLAKSDANRLLVFLQVELFALGLGRLGYDQLVLSRAAALDDSDRLDFTPLLMRFVLPFACVCAAVGGAGLRGPAGIAILVAAPCDVLSTVTGSFELSRRKYLTNIAFSWLNYPLFLLFLVLPGAHIDSSSLPNVLVLFCATSVGRAAIAVVLLAGHRRRRRPLTPGVSVALSGGAHRRRRLAPGVSVALSGGAHRRRRLAPGVSVALTRQDLFGSGTVSISQIIVQRGDGAVLALFQSRFPAAGLASYLLASRMLDASYTVSAVVASLAQVRGVDRVVSGSRSSRLPALLFGGAWFGIWMAAAITLAVLQWPHVFVGWGRLVLAVPAAALYLAIFRHVLRDLAEGRGAAIAFRFLQYVVIAVCFATVAVVTREPAVMFLTATIAGLWSLQTLRQSHNDF